MNIGIIGAAGRGSNFVESFKRTEFFNCHAFCDTNTSGLDALRSKEVAAEYYGDYREMFEKSDIEAVFIGTPMHLHAGMAIEALDRNLHVICEVTAGVTMAECQELTRAAARSKAIYMMAENYTFMKPNATIRDLVAKGLFGTPYYAEGEYIHELKALNVQTPWRRHWQTGMNGLTYPTHSLGPILQWFPGERLMEVCCAGSGHHHKDPEGKPYENEDTCVMLGKMTNGGLVKVRVDFLSDRPHAMTNYSLQGTDGAYESSRVDKGIDRIWLRSRNAKSENWEDLSTLWPEHMPKIWKDEARIAEAGHGGGDFLELLHFRDVILGAPNDLGIHQAMDMTLPGLISQQSILERGNWLQVPDSRDWI